MKDLNTQIAYVKESMQRYRTLFDTLEGGVQNPDKVASAYRWRWDMRWDTPLWETIYGLTYSGIDIKFPPVRWSTVRKGKLTVDKGSVKHLMYSAQSYFNEFPLIQRIDMRRNGVCYIHLKLGR